MIVLEASISDFDPLEIERLRKIILAYDGDKSLLELSNEELLKALGFTREQNGIDYPTITGLLVIGKSSAIERFVPTNSASFQVLEGTSVRVNEDYKTPVLASIEKLMSHLEVWNPEQELEIGLFRMPAPEFNTRAIREGIVNAFSHRDYSKMGRVRVAISDEGLTIANPGGFIEGVTIDNLLTAEPHGRNQLLADALKRVGLAEKTGRGIDRIYEGSLIYGRTPPDYSATTSATVTLFIPRCKPDLQLARLIANEQSRLGRPLPINTLLVLNALKDMPRSDVKQLSSALRLSETMVKTILDKAIDHGLVEAFGGGRGRNYAIAHQLYYDKKNTGYVLQKDIDQTRYLELITTLAQSNEFISRADIVNLLHVTDAQAYALLKKLVNQEVLLPVNKGRYAKYRLK